ncbi:MAG: YibE/F-like protein [Microgenomates bacterium OLB23]|nr:MAG: YibE/F-like protein [Microgenomates bacterium OLB23]
MIARWKGVAALLSMCFTFFVIFKFLLPQILSGQNPIIAAIMTGVFTVPVTYYASHGFNLKTHSAVLGTLIALIITSLLAFFAIDYAHLTGLSSEDAAFLTVMVEGGLNMKGLLLAGIIVGLLGILDDVTVSQAAIVFKLKENAPHLSFSEIYTQAMDIGKDHIGSVVNTLVLVYAGAALPFLLLFIVNQQTLAMGINYEVISEEIVRTLVASIGLMLAVPVTTFIAALQKKITYIAT